MTVYVSQHQAAKLEGVSIRHIQRRISQGKYQTRTVPSTKQIGKYKTEIAATSLPLPIQAKLTKERISRTPTNQPPLHPIDPSKICFWYQSLPKKHKEFIDKRQAIITDIKAKLEAIEEKHKTKSLIELAAHHRIKWRCYYRWQKAYDQEGLYGLRNKRYDQDRSKLTLEQKQYIVQLIKQNPDRRDSRIVEYLNFKFPEIKVSRNTVSRYTAAWKKKNHELYTFLKSPDNWKNNYLVSFGSHSEKAQRFLQYVELDSTPADLLCADGKRYTIIGGIDIYSRKVKCKVSPTSNGMSVAALIRSVIIDWGIPENIIRDNGKDYTSNHINSVLDSLEIKAITLPPFTPEGKPHIERFFRALSGSLFEEISGYIGHNVSDRRKIESRRSFAQRFMRKGSEPIRIGLHPEQFQEVMNKWIENVYHQKHHTGIKTTPELKATQSHSLIRHIKDERALDILLLPADEATVYKKGIRYQTGNYQSPDLAGFIKERVSVRRDLDNAGRLYVFDLEGNYITTAWDSKLEGIPDINYQQIRKEQKKQIASQKAAIKTLAEEPMIQLVNQNKELNKFEDFPKRQTARTRRIEKAANAALRNEGIKPERFKTIDEHMNDSGWENENELDKENDSLDFLEGCEIDITE
ncbi:MAG: Mu transposase C-terminal domain-containing protein [Nitrospinota bacterium]